MANLSQLWDPSVVATGFQFVNTRTGHTLIAEFARTFSTVGVSGGQGESHYQIQLQPGQTYHVAFAVFQGGAGESVDFKSISFWWNLYIQPANSGSTFLPLFLLGNAFTAPMIAFMLMNNNSLVRFSSKLGPVIRILRQIGNVSHTRS